MATVPLPEGAVLLHVGPYKTGSTAIQNALFDRQDVLAEHGVAYPGTQYRAARPGWAVINWSPAWVETPDISEWDTFAAEVREGGGLRVCVSTEDFGSTGRAELAQKIVGDLGGDNVHVLYVCRALHRVLPSHWQERVKSAVETRPYEAWLRSVLLPAERDEAGVAFWRSHDLDRVAPAWLAAVGPERFHLLVTDDSDRALLRTTFERMLALPDSYLDTDAGDGNQSMSMNAIELLRRLNVLATERGWPTGEYMELVRQGAFKELRAMADTNRDERIPTLPEWALAPTEQIADRRIETIKRLGLDAIGDPDCLRLPRDFEASKALTPPVQISMDAAVAFTAGLIERDHQVRDRIRGKVAEQRGRADRERRRAERLRAEKRALTTPTGAGQLGYRTLIGEVLRRPFRRG
jgi:hypothetical protein